MNNTTNNTKEIDNVLKGINELRITDKYHFGEPKEINEGYITPIFTNGHIWVRHELGDIFGTTKEQSEANAKYICLAVNNFSDILENLKRLVDRIEESELQDNFPSAYNRAKEAINKATL